MFGTYVHEMPAQIAKAKTSNKLKKNAEKKIKGKLNISFEKVHLWFEVMMLCCEQGNQRNMLFKHVTVLSVVSKLHIRKRNT